MCDINIFEDKNVTAFLEAFKLNAVSVIICVIRNHSPIFIHINHICKFYNFQDCFSNLYNLNLCIFKSFNKLQHTRLDLNQHKLCSMTRQNVNDQTLVFYSLKMKKINNKNEK